MRLKLLLLRKHPFTIKNTRIKQLCNRKVRDFAMALRARKVSGAFEKRALGMELRLCTVELR